MQQIQNIFTIFRRPLVVTVGKPNGWQILWAIITLVLMGDVLFAGFSMEWVARMYVDLFGGSIRDMYLILKGVTIGAALMTFLFAFGSNQVSVPFAMIENHRPTAVLVGFGLLVVGIVLNWPAVAAFIAKFDLLYALLAVLGLALIIGAIFGTSFIRRTRPTNT